MTRAAEANKVSLRNDFFAPVTQAAACPMKAARSALRWVVPLVAIAVMLAIVGLVRWHVLAL